MPRGWPAVMGCGMRVRSDGAVLRIGRAKKKAGSFWDPAFWGKAPGDDLLLHGLSHTTIGAVAFHFRVRDGIGWFHNAMVTRERVEGRKARWIELRARSRWLLSTR